MTAHTLQTSDWSASGPNPIGRYTVAWQRSFDDARGVFGLSRRELETLVMIASGESSASIAQQLGVGEATVETFRRRAYAKLGVRASGAAVTLLSVFLSGGDLQALPEVAE